MTNAQNISLLRNLTLNILEGGKLITDGFTLRNSTISMRQSRVEIVFNTHSQTLVGFPLDRPRLGIWNLDFNSQVEFKRSSMNTNYTSFTVMVTIDTTIGLGCLVRIRDKSNVIWNATLYLTDRSSEIILEDNACITLMGDTTVNGLINVYRDASIIIQARVR